MPEEQKTAETEQERLADFPRDLSRSFTYLHRQRKKYMDDRLRGYGFVGGMPMILLYINRHPGTTQDAIVSHMYIDKCTVAPVSYTHLDVYKRQGVYFNRSLGYNYYDLEQLKDFEFWLAEYRSVPAFYYNFGLWQYSDNAQVQGIDAAVDINVSFKNYG